MKLVYNKSAPSGSEKRSSYNRMNGKKQQIANFLSRLASFLRRETALLKGRASRQIASIQPVLKWRG